MPQPAHDLPPGVTPEVPLAPKTTLGVGGAAAYFGEGVMAADFLPMLAWARQHNLPVQVLGGGSNVVVHDAGLPGLVLRLCDPKLPLQIASEDASGVQVVVPGGADWSATAMQSVAMGLYGMECLVGIPGQVGAAPVQNIGAYGQELAHCLQSVTRLQLATGAIDTVAATACGLSYRASHFRSMWQGRYLITSVTMRLGRRRAAVAMYPALAKALAEDGIDAHGALPQQIADRVLDLRRSKGMVWAGPGLRSVGSFFVNPTVPTVQAEAMVQRLGPMPSWPGADGRKLSAAWLIEAAGMRRGWRCDAVGGRVGLSPLHALALVNVGCATAQDIVTAATQIYARVLAHSGVALQAEARPFGFAALQAPFLL